MDEEVLLSVIEPDPTECHHRVMKFWAEKWDKCVKPQWRRTISFPHQGSKACECCCLARGTGLSGW